MRLIRASLLAAVGMLLPGSAAAEPGCVTQCKTLEKGGELAANVSLEGCYVRVCQREGRRLYAEGEYAKALESLDFLFDKLDASPSYLLDLGLTFYALDRFDDALEAFERVVGGFPRNVRAGAQRAHTLVRLGRYDEAIAQFEKLRAMPESEGSFKELDTRSYLQGSIGVVKLIQGDVAGGKKDLIAALKADGRNKLAATYLNFVLPYLEAGDLDPEGVRQLVVAYEELGLRRLADAAEHLKQLLIDHPRYVPGYQRLAEILRSYEQYEACEEALKVAEAHLPRNIDLRAERLRCTLLRVGPATEAAAPALAELRDLRRTHPQNERVQHILTAVGFPP
ncbi:MAG: tetratricopeptide repeat protein [Myxococcota bacterium]